MPPLQAGYLHQLWVMRPGNILSGPPRAARLLIHLPRRARCLPATGRPYSAALNIQGKREVHTYLLDPTWLRTIPTVTSHSGFSMMAPRPDRGDLATRPSGPQLRASPISRRP